LSGNPASFPAAIFIEGYIKRPVQSVFYRPVKPDGTVNQCCVRLKGRDVQAGIFFFLSAAFKITYRFHFHKALQLFPFSGLFYQGQVIYNLAATRFHPTMPCILNWRLIVSNDDLFL
jgi:hypothetical protein